MEGAGVVVRVDGVQSPPRPPSRAFGSRRGRPRPGAARRRGPAQAGPYRTKAEIERFFDGRAKAAPQGVLVNDRHPGGFSMIEEARVHMYGGIAVKR
jgi:hypothetical protein